MKRRHGILLTIFATVLATTAAGISSAATEPTDTCPLSPILQPCEGRALFGGWAKGYTTGSFQKAIDEAGSRYKRRLDIVHAYHAPDGPSPIPFGKDKYGDGERHFAAEGRIVLANFKPGALVRKPGDPPYAPDFTATATGSHDASIRQAAENIKALGDHKVMLALHHEPEAVVDGGTTCETRQLSANPRNTPQAYRDMWRHTRAVFDDVGVTNVVWVMNYMSYSRWDCLVGELWPGNDLVDWIAYDPYSTDGTATTVTRFAAELTKRLPANDKPLMLAEYGARIGAKNAAEPARQLAREKSRAFYDNLGTLLDQRTVPRLQALVVFDSTVSSDGNFGVGQDTWGLPDPAEQEAFNRLAAHPAFLPTVTN